MGHRSLSQGRTTVAEHALHEPLNFSFHFLSSLSSSFAASLIRNPTILQLPALQCDSNSRVLLPAARSMRNGLVLGVVSLSMPSLCNLMDDPRLSKKKKVLLKPGAKDR